MKLNASDALIKTLINNGLEVVFANPGTSEMHLVAAIDHNPKVRPGDANIEYVRNDNSRNDLKDYNLEDLSI